MTSYFVTRKAPGFGWAPFFRVRPGAGLRNFRQAGLEGSFRHRDSHALVR